MARPKKEGLDVFPLEVTFNDTVESMIAMHEHGLTWLIRFWQSAYKTMTGTVDLRGALGGLFRKKCGVTPKEHEAILKDAIKNGICRETENGLYVSPKAQATLADKAKRRAAAIKRLKKAAKPPVPIKEKEEEKQKPVPRKKRKARITVQYLDTVYLTDEEYERLKKELGERFVKACIKYLDEYLTNNPKKRKQYQDHNKVIRNWVIDKIRGRMQPAPEKEPVKQVSMTDDEKREQIAATEDVVAGVLRKIGRTV